MKIFRNRSVMAVLGICFAAAVCFVLAPAINQSSNRETQIVRVVKIIPEGTSITKDMIQTVKVGGLNLPANISTDEKAVIGKFALAELDPGDYILDSKIADKAKSSYLSNLDGKKQAISISIKSFAAGLSGKLQNGDIIQLLVSDYGDNKQTFAPPELNYIKLLAATTAKGADTDQIKNADNKDTSKEADNIPATLTLLVTQAQATKLVDYENNGKLYASFVYRGTAEGAQKYLDIQDQYFHKQNGSGTGGIPSNVQ